MYTDKQDPRLRASRRKHYANNKDQYKRRNDDLRVKTAAIIVAAKSNPCMDCGRSYPPYVMDFDHRDPGTKRGTITAMARYGVKTLLAEIAKCDLVCANCHRERTWGSGSG